MRQPVTPWMRRLYKIRSRCNDSGAFNFNDYGGRGIRCLLSKQEIEKLWLRDKAGDLKQPSIDRIDNDGDYTFENCQFIEVSENSKKRRNTLHQYCPRGHPYFGSNLKIKHRSNGYKSRQCRECARLSRAKYRRKNVTHG